MVADVYSHIIDDDRRIYEQGFEKQFYQDKAYSCYGGSHQRHPAKIRTGNGRIRNSLRLQFAFLEKMQTA